MSFIKWNKKLKFGYVSGRFFRRVLVSLSNKTHWFFRACIYTPVTRPCYLPEFCETSQAAHGPYFYTSQHFKLFTSIGIFAGILRRVSFVQPVDPAGERWRKKTTSSSGLDCLRCSLSLRCLSERPCAVCRWPNFRSAEYSKFRQHDLQPQCIRVKV